MRKMRWMLPACLLAAAVLTGSAVAESTTEAVQAESMTEGITTDAAQAGVGLTDGASGPEEPESAAADTAAAENVQAGQVASAAERTSLTVGNTTRMNGDFFTDLWGNATSDLDVRQLLHGYNLITWDSAAGGYAVNPQVVSGFIATKNAQGDHTYRISLCEDLVYSDGTPITAKDYAFSILLCCSPQVRELGGNSRTTACIEGSGAYADGTQTTLSGVRIQGEYELSITVSHEYLPYFYELGYLNYVPYPISVIAPGCEVKDDGRGAFIEGSGGAAFTAELLSETVMDEQTGYRSHPSVVSGAYTLKSFDGETAVFERNPLYKGDPEGNVPSIDELVYTLAENSTMIDKLESGEFDLLNKVSSQEAVSKGLELASGKEGFAMDTYPRVGLSFVVFSSKGEAVQSAAVRQAIAWAMDRQALSDGYEGNYGICVNGFYGIGQWMYGLLQGTTGYPVLPPEEDASEAEQQAYEKELEAWEALRLDTLEDYTTADPDSDLAKAAALLEEDGWTVPAEGGTRVRENGGESTALELTLGYPQGSAIGPLLEEHLGARLEQIGVSLLVEPVEMGELLKEYYGQTEPIHDMLYLASNFSEVFDPSLNFVTDEQGSPRWMGNGIADQQLYDLAVDLRKTEPGDTLSYCTKWLAFQKRFTEVLPAVPVYSNGYFDFYRNTLQNYDPIKRMTWTQEIQGAWIGESPAEAAAEEEVEFID